MTIHARVSPAPWRVKAAWAAALVAAAGLSAAIPAAAQGTAAAAQPGALVGTSQLPTLGDGGDLGLGAERRLGERIAREIYRDPDYLDDPVLVEYVQGIWQPLLAAARGRGELSPEMSERFAWEVMLGRDRSINAFALPGGYLGLHLGLVAAVSNRDELASVLAHELSHVTQRHISRLMSKQSQQAPLVIAALILGALAASKSPDMANAMIVGGQAAAIQNQLNFSRDMEREADRVGFGVMTQAGFDAQGFVTMFDKLQQASRLNDNGAFPYLRSHPLTTERIADMQSRQPLGTRAPDVAQQTIEHALVAARARVLSNPGADALRASLQEVDRAPQPGIGAARQAGALYGATLAAIRLREFQAARALQLRLASLVEADAAGARLTRLLAVELELAAPDAPATPAPAQLDAWASGATADTLGVFARQRPELFLSAAVLLRSGQAAEAAQRLQTWVATHPRDAQAWQLLSSACAAQGQTLRAIRAEAEVQVALLDYAAAADRFRAAQELVRQMLKPGASGGMPDHIEASIIDTRARQVQSVLREQALER